MYNKKGWGSWKDKVNIKTNTYNEHWESRWNLSHTHLFGGD